MPGGGHPPSSGFVFELLAPKIFAVGPPSGYGRKNYQTGPDWKPDRTRSQKPEAVPDRTGPKARLDQAGLDWIRPEARPDRTGGWTGSETRVEAVSQKPDRLN